MKRSGSLSLHPLTLSFPFSFQEYVDEIDKKIEEIVNLIKGELEKGIRITLGNLIISYVHGEFKTH